MPTHRIGPRTELLAQTVLTSERPKLVLSPHLDDALLSAFAVVASGPCEVWTVFAGRPFPTQTTSWDLSCGFPDSDHTMTARVAEDDAAFAGLSVQVRRFPALDGAYTTPARRRRDLAELRTELEAWTKAHPDGVIVAPVGAGLHVPLAWWQRARDEASRRLARRWHSIDADVSDGEAPGSSADAASPATPPDDRSQAGAPGLRARVRPLVGRLSALVRRAMHADAQRRRRKVLGPDGLAANPDHLDVRDLVLSHVPQTDSQRLDIVFFEDLPYLWHEDGSAEAARLHGRGVELQQVTVSVDRSAKFTHLEHYTSQMPVMDLAGRLLQADTIPDQERYWLVVR